MGERASDGEEQSKDPRGKLRKRSIPPRVNSKGEEIENEQLGYGHGSRRPTSENSADSGTNSEDSSDDSLNIGSQLAKEDLARMSTVNFEDGFVVDMPTLRHDDPVPLLLTHEEIYRYQATIRRLSTPKTDAQGSSIRASLRTYPPPWQSLDKSRIQTRNQETISVAISRSQPTQHRQIFEKPVLPVSKPIARKPVPDTPTPRAVSSPPTMGATTAAARAMQNHPGVPSSTGPEWETSSSRHPSSGKFGILRKIFSKTSPRILPPQVSQPTISTGNSYVPSPRNFTPSIDHQSGKNSSTAQTSVPPCRPNPLHKIDIQYPPPAHNLHITDSDNATLRVHSSLLGFKSRMNLVPNADRRSDRRISVTDSQELDSSWHSDELGGWVEITPDTPSQLSSHAEEIRGRTPESRSTPSTSSRVARTRNNKPAGKRSSSRYTVVRTIYSDETSVQAHSDDNEHHSSDQHPPREKPHINDENTPIEQPSNTNSRRTSVSHRSSGSYWGHRQDGHLLIHRPNTPPSSCSRCSSNPHQQISPTSPADQHPHPHSHPQISRKHSRKAQSEPCSDAGPDPDSDPMLEQFSLIHGILLMLWWILQGLYTALWSVLNFLEDQYQSDQCQEFLNERMREVREGCDGEGMKRAAFVVLWMLVMVCFWRTGWLGWFWGYLLIGVGWVVRRSVWWLFGVCW